MLQFETSVFWLQFCALVKLRSKALDPAMQDRLFETNLEVFDPSELEIF